MKFMKLGSRPDTFYTEEATRAVMSDVPSDLSIKINNITYLVHKYPVVPKCGLLQRLCSEAEADNVTVELDDIPGGEEGLEVCAKYCYGITINLSAHNLASSFCAASYLAMTDAVEPGNLLMKLEAFFSSCILQSWKDPIVTLHNTHMVFDCSENLGIVRRCIESIVDKILTPPNKVTWSYTYTRPGYHKSRHQSVPKDWWTEDISFLNVDMFRCVVAAVKSANALHPQLIGEALHVYACRWMPEIAGEAEAEAEASTSRQEDRRVLETVVSLIPAERGSVSIRFLLRLLSVANHVGASPATRAELLRLAAVQLEEATLSDLLMLRVDERSHDVELIQTVLESFVRQWKRQVPADERESMKSIRKIGKLIDSYLQVVARDAGVPVHRMACLAEALPGIARPHHDDLYKAINIYLKEHPDLSKADKKQLCRVLDCQKLSPEICGHAVRNERLPLRTVVQLLYFEHEKANSNSRKQVSPDAREPSTSRSEPSFKVRGEESKNSRLELNSREKALITRISHNSHS